MTQDEFNQLLAWLDTDPDRAGQRYESIRRNLITVFLNRQCNEPEDLADETINRVAKRVPELRKSYIGDPERYFHGVAKNVRREYYRRSSRVIQISPPEPQSDEVSPYSRCLEKCLAQLPPEQARLILLYYEEQKKAKIESHRAIGEALNLKAGALRARVFRVREKLRKCIEDCVKRGAGE